MGLSPIFSRGGPTAARIVQASVRVSNLPILPRVAPTIADDEGKVGFQHRLFSQVRVRGPARATERRHAGRAMKRARTAGLRDQLCIERYLRKRRFARNLVRQR